MEIDIVGESLKFMILGMMIVFVFLVVLVQVMKLQAVIITKYFPAEKVPEVPTSSGTLPNDAHHVAAIVAAIADFRKNKS